MQRPHPGLDLASVEKAGHPLVGFVTQANGLQVLSGWWSPTGRHPITGSLSRIGSDCTVPGQLLHLISGAPISLVAAIPPVGAGAPRALFPSLLPREHLRRPPRPPPRPRARAGNREEGEGAAGGTLSPLFPGVSSAGTTEQQLREQSRL